ncbi:MAG: alpha-keto acid decarboxylase family protein, partial [Pirellulaceae bacterium]|nr:alpha-keto acid decarboxylase family protein [Pirellulaceae bacterium]
VLSFYSMLERSPLQLVGCTREDCAGFAADAYARLNGISAVCVTYCVGGLSLCNSIAGAYAEKSPVVVVSGSPGMRERADNPLLHHRVKDFRTQAEVFRRICCAEAELNDPGAALRDIDRVLSTVARLSRPGFIELPRDMVHVVPEGPHLHSHRQPSSNSEALSEAVADAVQRIEKSDGPVIIAGVEIQRFGLQDKLISFAEEANIPIAATMLGKSVVDERHPLFIGLYQGAMGREDVTRFVEQSDCIILLGESLTDINTGIFTANLPTSRTIFATSELLRISHHRYSDVLLGDFLAGLADAGLKKTPRKLPRKPEKCAGPWKPENDKPITIRRLIARLNQTVNDSMVIIADPGDALFASSELVVHGQTTYLSPAYYTSMGFSVPGALGAATARPDLRPLVLVGDGAFQMTGMELSTIVGRGLNPIVILLDNLGYGTERVLHPGDHRFNDVHPWQYHKLPEVLGKGRGYDVRMEADFDAALQTALDDDSQMHLLHVHIDLDDRSATLDRLAEKMSGRV